MTSRSTSTKATYSRSLTLAGRDTSPSREAPLGNALLKTCPPKHIRRRRKLRFDLRRYPDNFIGYTLWNRGRNISELGSCASAASSGERNCARLNAFFERS